MAIMAIRQPDEYGYQDTSLRAMGGADGVSKLVDLFYDAMETRPDAQKILHMHPKELGLSREKLKVFLVGWLGGPKLYRERWGPIRIPLAHAHLPIDQPERDAWMACMEEAVEQMPVAPDFKAYFLEQIAVPANRVLAVSQARRQGPTPS